MSQSNRVRFQRILREAEGYLDLGMPRHALDVLARMREPGTFKGQKLYLNGEALRALGRFADACPLLEQAADLIPSKIEVWVALGWCYKRSGRLERAIEALQRGLEIEPNEAILYYNLACYWSLLGQKERALQSLSRALAIQPDYREMIGEESDFDPIRSDPDFQALTGINV